MQPPSWEYVNTLSKNNTKLYDSFLVEVKRDYSSDTVYTRMLNVPQPFVNFVGKFDIGTTPFNFGSKPTVPIPPVDIYINTTSNEWMDTKMNIKEWDNRVGIFVNALENLNNLMSTGKITMKRTVYVGDIQLFSDVVDNTQNAKQIIYNAM